MLICDPVISVPSSLSNDIPNAVTLKGNARGGDIGDFASFINLWPARQKGTVIVRLTKWIKKLMKL